MTTPKYKININHLEQRRGIERLQRDGFSREQISKSMYKATEGMPQAQRTELMSKLFDRS
jgi:hypothetical protein